MAIAMLLVAAPAAAEKPMEASGIETFFLTPTCSSILGEIPNAPDCKTAGPNTFLTLLNPGFRTGSFTGEQLFEGRITLFADGDFVFRGILTFEGTVEGCGDGTVVFWNEGYGNLATGLTRNVQHTVAGGSLGVHANLTLTSLGPDTNTIEGSYHC